MHGDEVSSIDEVALDLQLGQGGGHGWQDVAAAEQRGAQRHEVGDRVVAIADELVEDAGDERERFGVVKAQAAGQAALG